MADIDITMDIKDVVSQTRILLGLTDQQTKALEAYTVASVKYNRATDDTGKVVNYSTATIRSQISATQTLEGVVRETAKGYEVLSAKIKNNNEALKQQAEAAKNAIAANQKAIANQQKSANELRIASLDKRVREFTQEERNNSKDVTGLDFSKAGVGQLTVISRRVAEVGAAAGLTSKQLTQLFVKVAGGDFGNIDTKYAKVVDQILRYNSVLENEQNRVAKINTNKSLNAAVGLPPGSPISGSGNTLPTPNTGAIDKLKEYLGFLTRIQSTLTNLALYRGFNFITKQLTESVGSAQELQIQVSLIRTLSQDAQRSAEDWARSLRNVSSATGFTAKEIGDLAYDLISNQVIAGNGVEALTKQVAEFARVANSSPKDAGNLISSVLNTYGDEAGNVDQISSKLFTTIDRGRVVVSQLNETFARTTFVGRELGVGFNEILASITTLTRAGIKSDEAVTLLNNAFQKLSNPSEKLKAILADLGYVDPKNAISQEKFIGTLKLIVNAAREGKIALAELFPEARAQRFISAFANDAKTFQSELDILNKDDGKRFEGAKTIRGESDADKIQKNLRTIENSAAEGFGTAATKLLGQFITLTAETTKFKQELASLFAVVVSGAAGVTTFVVTMRAFAAIQELAQARALRLAASEAAKQAAMLRANGETARAIQLETQLAGVRAGGKGGVGGFAGANPLLSAATLAIGLASAYTVYKSTAIDSFNSAAQAYDEYKKAIEKEDVVQALEKQNDKVKVLKTSFESVATILKGQLATAIKANSSALTDIRDRIKSSDATLRASFTGALDIARNQVSKLRQDFSLFNSEIEQSKKSVAAYGDGLRDLRIGTLQKYATPLQSLEITKNQFDATREQAKKLYAIGTPEAIAEARKLYDKLGQLSTQYYEKDADIRKENQQKQYEQDLANGTAQPGQNLFTYDASKQLETENTLVRERIALEEKLQEQLAKKAKLAETEAAKADTKRAKLESDIKAFEDFSIFEPNSDNIKAKYKDNKGQLDQKKVDADLKSITGNLTESLGTNVLDRLGFKKEVDQRTELLKAEVKRVTTQKELGDTQTDLSKTQEKVNESFKKSKDSLKAYNEEILKVIENSKLFNNTAKEIAEKAPDAIVDARRTGGVSTATGRGVLRALGDFGEAINPTTTKLDVAKGYYADVTKQAQTLDGILKDLPKKTIETDAGTVIDPKAVSEALSKLKTLKESLRAAVKDQIKQEGLNADPGSFVIPGVNRNLKDLEDDIEGLSAKLRGAYSTLQQSQAQNKEAVENLKILKDTVESSSKAYVAVNNATLAIVGGFGVATDTQLENLKKLVTAAGTAKEAIDNLGKSATIPNGTPQILNEIPVPKDEFLPSRRSYGGPIYRAYGGPVGEDRQMAWLAEGEYVMNRQATRRFYSQIVQQNNAGRVPGYFNQGGEVTNMGGVSINVHESRNPNQTAREVARILGRGKRMGTI